MWGREWIRPLNPRSVLRSAFVLRKIITFCEEDLRVVRMLVDIGSLKLGLLVVRKLDALNLH